MSLPPSSPYSLPPPPSPPLYNSINRRILHPTTVMKLQHRLRSSTLILLVILQVSAMVLFRIWYLKANTCTSTISTNQKVHVLLLSSWRSGSSFLGQAFNQHPNVFYLMEPGWHLWTTMQKPGMRSMKMALRDLMRNLFLCDFSVMDSYLPDQRNISSLFMWSHSRALCSPPVCSLTPRDQFSNQTLCDKKCDSRGLEKVQEACTTYSHVVLKEVRFFELESLYPLFQDPSLDLRIIHLIRDPRAVERSREESVNILATDRAIVLEQNVVSEAEAENQVLQEICRSHVHIYKKATVNAPPFLTGRYRMVRFEDLVRNPLEEMAALYEFAGLEMTPLLGDWIYTLTHGKLPSRDATFKVTSRDASYVSQAWRNELPHGKVRRIQQVCEEAMAVIGYRAADSEEQQKNISVDLLVPRNSSQFRW